MAKATACVFSRAAGCPDAVAFQHLQNDFLIVLSMYASVIDENVVQFDEAAVEPRREDGLGQMDSVFALGGCPQFPAVYLVRAGVPNGRARPEAAAGVAVAGRLASARAFERHRIRHQFSGSGGDAALRFTLFLAVYLPYERFIREAPQGPEHTRLENSGLV
ncbi:hypothetical protein A6764_14605 [Brevibacillus sp. WF146]|uniref:hypothetical protein n=1 Tax=Brevibacillus sp. WF146 TaxID=319501 RepID=UPI0011464E49|nr:hypothetical protein [Brevibacillus sp. WF146]UYZ12062.1 hypothetical protein A6764_14605 [Brevibacillus sp. WF146]